MPDIGFVVTGGAGFIGSHLVDRLAERGRVLVLDDLSTGSERNLERAAAAGRVDVAVGDVCNETFVANAVRAVPATAFLFHLATRNLRRGLGDPLETRRVNETGARVLVDSWSGRPGRFVHVSTSEVLGTSDAPLDEASLPRPLTVYGSSKLAGEEHVARARRAGAIDATIVRPFNAYGPRAHVEGDAGELIPRYLVRASRGEPLPVFGDGAQTRTFTYVTDTVEGLLRAADRPAGEHPWLLASDDEISVLEVARLVGEVVGRATMLLPLPSRPGDLARQRANASASRRALGWTPRVTFAEGLARTWEALRPRSADIQIADMNWSS